MRSFKQRHLFIVAALFGTVAAFAACGDDDDTGNGGTAGSTAGSGGSAGKGGGTGGTAGKDAGGGSGGSDGGIAGSAGTAGKGGNGGASGAGGSAGKAGGGGTAGKGGTGGAAGTAVDGGVRDVTVDSEAGGTTANIRVAHLSPGAPAVDFCLALHGTTVFNGPVLSGQAVLTGLPYGAVTKYQTVSPGQYDVRIVAAGATTCATSLGGLPDQTSLPSVPANGAMTIAAIGELSGGDAGGDGGTQPFGLKGFMDDTSVAAGKAKLRFVHASSGTPSVDVGTSGGALFNPVFNDVAFGNTAAGTNGYVETEPLANIEISARAHGTTNDVLSIVSADLASGTIASAFAIGKIGNVAAPLKVLLCLDNGATVGALTPCTVLGDTPKRAHIRVAHLVPDAPAVDVCFATTGSAFSGTGLLHRLNITTGLAYAQVTSYLDVPVASYTVRVVAGTAMDCLTPVAPDTGNIATLDNVYATVGALGDFTAVPDGGLPEAGASDGGADAGTTSSFGINVFVDDKAAPIPAGNINLRFIHASPGTAAVDVGLGSAGTFTPVFTNVAFRHVGVGAGIDPNGYVSTGPLAAQTLSARLSGGTTDAVVVPNVTVTANTLATAFAIGKPSDAVHPLKILLCLDSNAPTANLTSCTAAP